MRSTDIGKKMIQQHREVSQVSEVSKVKGKVKNRTGCPAGSVFVFILRNL
jgi:hypothetical protein